MAKKKTLHERMKANPKDWRIADVETVCAEWDLTINPPMGGGSHYRIRAKGVAFVLTIPARRPIKAIYIKLLTNFIDDHCVNMAVEKG